MDLPMGQLHLRLSSSPSAQVDETSDYNTAAQRDGEESNPHSVY